MPVLPTAYLMLSLSSNLGSCLLRLPNFSGCAIFLGKCAVLPRLIQFISQEVNIISLSDLIPSDLQAVPANDNHKYTLQKKQKQIVRVCSFEFTRITCPQITQQYKYINGWSSFSNWKQLPICLQIEDFQLWIIKEYSCRLPGQSMKRQLTECLSEDLPTKRMRTLPSDEQASVSTQNTETQISRNLRIMNHLLLSCNYLNTVTPPTTTTISLPTTKPSKPIFKPVVVSHNWFTSENPNPKTDKHVALDCEFVQSGNKHLLACISIVSETGDVLINSYVKPTQKITNYLTFISGITYEKIKHAPTWVELRPKVESVLRNTILVGHTIQSDLKVMGMEGWEGFKSIVDISKMPAFKDENRVQSLRKLAMKHLGMTIQTGSHSSLEDAQATMDLFLLQKTTEVVQTV